MPSFEAVPSSEKSTVDRLRVPRPQKQRVSSWLEYPNEEDDITLVRKRSATEDATLEQRTRERIQQKGLQETLMRFQENSIRAQTNAQEKLDELKAHAAQGELNEGMLAFYRQGLANDRSDLMKLQQYGMTQPTSPELKEALEQGYNMIVAIEEGIHAAEAKLNSQRVARTWSLDTHPFPEASSAPGADARLHPEDAALANKFNASAKKIEKSKKGLWGKIKAWFS